MTSILARRLDVSRRRAGDKVRLSSAELAALAADETERLFTEIEQRALEIGCTPRTCSLPDAVEITFEKGVWG